jgi:MFS family permease
MTGAAHGEQAPDGKGVARRQPPGEGRRPPLGRNVLALAAVSLLTDLSSEMIYPLLPLFMGTVLGASAAFIGVVEGAAESTAALLKLASGWWSDRVRRRKPLVVAGYVLAAAMRPLIGLAQSATHVLAIRVIDRVGKGIRSSPRDALIADTVHPAVRGRAFGFHRGADHAGAVLGPLAAFALLQLGGLSLRELFLWAAVPGALAVVVLVVGVREAPAARAARGGRRGRSPEPRRPTTGDEPLGSATAARGAPPHQHDDSGARDDADHSAAHRSEAPLPTRFRAYLAIVLLFTLGNSTDAFLLLRANELGVPAALVPVLWAALHVVKSASSFPGGALSDRFGRKPLIVAGWTLYALVYFAFGRATDAWQAWALFGLYGVYFGLTEGAEKALVADLVPASRRGVAFGWYNLAVGLAALPASLLFGVVWDRMGASAAFTLGGALALAAAGGLVLVVPARRSAA